MDGLAPDIDYVCPRCAEAVTGRFYGPCAVCAVALGEAFPGGSRQVETPEYEPKMNVTPNAIATKD